MYIASSKQIRAGLPHRQPQGGQICPAVPLSRAVRGEPLPARRTDGCRPVVGCAWSPRLWRERLGCFPAKHLMCTTSMRERRALGPSYRQEGQVAGQPVSFVACSIWLRTASAWSQLLQRLVVGDPLSGVSEDKGVCGVQVSPYLLWPKRCGLKPGWGTRDVHP